MLIPCRTAILDLEAITDTVQFLATTGIPALVVLNAVSPHGHELAPHLLSQALSHTRIHCCLHILQAFVSVPMMTGKQRKTLTAVFRDPVSGTIERAALEGLLIAAGARVIEGRGSRVRFEKDGEVETFHRPHPTKEAKRYQIRAARAFLERMGITP